MTSTCKNPLCKAALPPPKKRGRPREFCDDECKLDFWSLARAANLLLPRADRALEILKELSR